MWPFLHFTDFDFNLKNYDIFYQMIYVIGECEWNNIILYNQVYFVT